MWNGTPASRVDVRIDNILCVEGQCQKESAQAIRQRKSTLFLKDKGRGGTGQNFLNELEELGRSKKDVHAFEFLFGESKRKQYGYRTKNEESGRNIVE